MRAREAAAQPGAVQDGAGSTATTRTTWDEDAARAAEAAAATSFDFDTILQSLYSFSIYIFKFLIKFSSFLLLFI
jgi:hypothetical protein